MYLIVGLGNPGKEYQMTRHNIGFIIVDKLLESYPGISSAKKFDGIVYTGEEINKQKVVFLKPQTYMNLSGASVVQACAFYKIPKSNVIVIHDDIDLKLGDIRCKVGGGHAGHNGLKSIDVSIGKEYHRIRIGVGRPEMKEMVSGYVLQNFLSNEIDEILKNMPAINALLSNLLTQATI